MEGFFMMIGLFLLFVVVAAIAGFVMGLSLRGQVHTLAIQQQNQQNDIVVLRRMLRELEAKMTSAPPPAAAPETEKPAEMAPASEPVAEEPGPAGEPKPMDEPKPAEEPVAAMSQPTSVPSTARPALAQSAPTQPAPRQDFEQMIGTRWAVWVGALALALGGVFLVRYSIEQGFFGPGARVFAGFVFAMILLGAGEFLRRRETEWSTATVAGAPIPALLTAAATMTAFGTVFAAHALYDLIGPGPAFILLAFVAFATMLASMLHGPWLAGLGLLGAMASPLLVQSSTPNYPVLAAYLVVTAAAGYTVAVYRGWSQIGRATMGAVTLWGLLLAMTTWNAEAAFWFYVVAQMAVAAVVIGWWPTRSLPDREAHPARESLLALLLLAGVLLFFLVEQSKLLVPGALAMIAVLAAAGWMAPVIAGGLTVGGLLAAVFLLEWPGIPAPEVPPALAQSAILGMPLPEAVSDFALFAATLAMLVSVPALLRLWRGSDLPKPTAGLLALAGVVTPLLLLAIAWLRIRQFAVSPEFAGLAGVLAAAYTGVAFRFRASSAQAHGIAFEALAGGAVAAIALGLTMVLDRGYLTVALALAAAGTAWVTSRGPANSLRIAAGVLGAIVLARIIRDPAIMAGNPGPTPILNWLLFGYGVPALAFAYAARTLRAGGEDWPQKLLDGLSVLFAALLVTFQIRHLVNGGNILVERTTHLELGLHVLNCAMFATVLMRIDPFDRNPVYRYGSLGFALLTLPMTVLGLMLSENPLFSTTPVRGGWLLNSLLLGYAAPAAALGAFYVVSRGRRPEPFRLAIAALGLALAFLYVSLEIRLFFQGPVLELSIRRTSSAELWTYSAAWLLMGILMLAGGIVLRSRSLRLASAAFIIASVLKVFLIDMSGLAGAWRALSFIGLGGVLMAIGLVYQRFVFTRNDGAGGAAPPAEPEPPVDKGGREV